MIHLKTETEIEKMRKSCKIVSEVLNEVSSIIKEGIRTKDIDAEAERLLLKRGALPAFKGYRGYKHATCLSVNEQVVHGVPSDRKLKNGDIISVDIGSLVDGYYGDVAYTFPVGEISKGAKRLVSVTSKAMERAIQKVKAGNHIGDISFEVEDEARKNNFSVVRDLFGHGIGRNLHEDPLIPNFGKKGEGPELKAGMIFAIEPMINIGSSKIKTLSDGWTVVTWDKMLSCHFEHTVLVTKKGVEILTSWPKIKTSLN